MEGLHSEEQDWHVGIAWSDIACSSISESRLGPSQGLQDKVLSCPNQETDTLFKGKGKVLCIPPLVDTSFERYLSYVKITLTMVLLDLLDSNLCILVSVCDLSVFV
jgi:hypothetical protein